jgi:alpha-tubulin suppressor-like RCC1 family protein
VTIQNQTNETEVFGSGENMRGQLGSGGTRHVQDLTLIESLSNFQIKDKNNI